MSLTPFLTEIYHFIALIPNTIDAQLFQAPAGRGKRSRNFSEMECSLLLQLFELGDRTSIVELKKTDRSTKEQKDKTWAAVLAEFCAQGGGADRNVEQLKGVWKRMKENAKKERTEEKREIRRTGGGAAQHSMTQEAQIVCGMLPPEQLDAQLEAMDSDYRVQPPSFHTPSPNSPIASSSYIFPLSQHETVAIPSPPEGGILASTTVST